MNQPIVSKKVAILVANGFSEVEMTGPQRALIAAGAQVKIVSSEPGLVNGWHGMAWGHYFPIDIALSDCLASDFDMLVIPGGRRSIDKLAGNPHTGRIIRAFMDGTKPVVVLGNAVELLAMVERAQGRTVTGTPESQTRMEAAGAVWSAETLVTDRNLMTAAPDVGEGHDLPEDLKQAIVRHASQREDVMHAA